MATLASKTISPIVTPGSPVSQVDFIAWAQGLEQAARSGGGVVIVADLANAPIVSTEGTQYIVGAAPTGDFAAQAGNIAVRINAGGALSWSFTAPQPGTLAFLKTTGVWMQRNTAGTAWAVADLGAVPAPKDQAGAPGSPVNGQIWRRSTDGVIFLYMAGAFVQVFPQFDDEITIEATKLFLRDAGYDLDVVKMSEIASAANHRVSTSFSATIGQSIEYEVIVRDMERTSFELVGTTSSIFNTTVDCLKGITTAGAATIEKIGERLCRVKLTAAVSATGSVGLSIRMHLAGSGLYNGVVGFGMGVRSVSAKVVGGDGTNLVDPDITGGTWAQDGCTRAHVTSPGISTIAKRFEALSDATKNVPFIEASSVNLGNVPAAVTAGVWASRWTRVVEPVPFDGVITKVYAAGAVEQVVAVQRATLAAGVYTPVPGSRRQFLVPAGSVSVDTNIPVLAGEYLFSFFSQAPYITSGLDASNLFIYSASQALTGLTSTWGSRIAFGVKIEGAMSGVSKIIGSHVGSRMETQIVGPAAPAAAGTVGGASYYAYGTPARFDGFVTRIRAASASSQVLSISIYDRDAGTGVFTRASLKTFDLVAGLNTFQTDIAINAGQYVGYRFAGGVYYTAKWSEQIYFSAADLSGLAGTYNLGNQQHEITFDIEGTVSGGVAALTSRVDSILSSSIGTPWLGKKIAVIGTSIVEQGEWTTRFEARLGCILQNLGIGGAVLSGGGAIAGSIASIDVDSDAVIIADLINDFTVGTLGTLPSAPTADTSTFANSLYAAIAAIKVRAPNAVIGLHTMYGGGATGVVAPPRNAFTTGPGGTRLHQWQKMEADMGEMLGLPVVDIGRKSGIGYITAPLLTYDDLHLNALGGEVYAAYAADRWNNIKPLT